MADIFSNADTQAAAPIHWVEVVQDKLDPRRVNLLVDGKPLPFPVDRVTLSIDGAGNASMTLSVPHVGMASVQVHAPTDIEGLPGVGPEELVELWHECFGKPGDPATREKIAKTVADIEAGRGAKMPLERFFDGVEKLKRSPTETSNVQVLESSP